MALQLVPLAQLSEDFGLIEYQLQLQLSAPRLKIDECFLLKNPHIEAQFMNFCKTMSPQNITDVFVPTSALQQPISDIASKGIKVNPKSGFKFRVGSFDIDRNQESIEVVKLTVALGNTLNFQAISSELSHCAFADDIPTNSNLRSGYHSLCISEDNDYVVFNSAQIKTCHLIRFSGGSELTEYETKGDICDNCNSAPATLWCINDQAKLCERCDLEIHSGSRIREKHKRVTLSEARAMMEFCPHHEDVRVEYYCTQCQTPVCIKCKMTGSHSKGDAASHVLIPIKEAYSEAVDAAQHEDPIFVRRKQAITDKLKMSDTRLRLILENAQNVEQEIMRIAKAAIEKSKILAGEKALVVRSSKRELERKLEELNNISRFISIQKSATGPLAFLRAFDRHSMIVANIQGNNDLPLDIKVDGDLGVYGNIEVAPASDGKPIARLPSQKSFTNIQSPVPPQKTQQSPRMSLTLDEKPAIPKKDPVIQPKQNTPPSPIEEKQYSEPEEEILSSATFDDSPKKPITPPKPAPVIATFPSVQTTPTPQKKKPLESKSAMKPRPEPISLVEMARKKEQKNLSKGIDMKFQPFDGSSILLKPNQRYVLYLCFPFKAQPQTHLLFSTERDGRSIAKMHEMIDNIGITVVIVKKGDFIFGGFAAAKWNTDEKPFGSGSSSFMFSVSLDAYIPYNPRVNDACCLYATKDTLTFGKYDLILADNFDGCSAMIENSYGIGFEQGSTEAQTFLAGEPVFKADSVEVWGFFTID